MTHHLSCVHHLQNGHHPIPRKPLSPKIREQQPRRNNKIRQAIVYGNFSQNIQHSYLMVCFVFLLTLKPASEDCNIIYDIDLFFEIFPT